MPRYFLALVGILGIASVFAASKNATLNVSATVMSVCEANVNSATLDFGTHFFIRDDIPVTGQPNGGAVRVKCTNGTSYRVLLDSGQSGSANSRYLINSSSGVRINYNLYRDAAHSSIWDDQVGITGIANGQEVWLPIYGVISAQPTVAAGAYTDTIKITVIW